jgi:PAS domain S-box-containing protein
MEDSQSLDQQVEAAYRRLRELLERSGASPEALEMLATLTASCDASQARAHEEAAARRQAESQREAALAQREAALEEARSLARFPAENPNPILRLDPAGTLLYANQASTALLREWDCRVGDPVPPIYRDLVADAMADGTLRTVDVPGGEQVYSFSVVPVVEAGYVNLYGRDVTVRKRAEAEREQLLEENRRQRQFLERLLETAPIGVAVVRGPEHRYEFANAYYQAIPGTPASVPMVGRTVAEVFPDAAAHGSLAGIEAAYATGQTASVREYEANVGPGREQTYWDSDRVPLKAPDGSVEGVLIVARDVTTEVLARRQVAELAARDEAILNSLAEGIITFDTGGNVLMANLAAIRMQGPGRIDAVQGQLADLATQFKLRHPDGRSLAPEEWPIRRALRGETFGNCEAQLQRLDTGQTWTVSYGGAPVRDAAGHVTMGLLTLRDITAQKQAEQERERLLAELHTANEELQAKNEELQSQAEEMEVQAEELRSQAEELHFQTLSLEKERARLGAIIDTMPEALLVADERGEVVLANSAAERLLAMPAHELGRPADRESMASYRPNHTPYNSHELPIFRAAVHRETQRDIPMALPWPDGQWRDVLVSAVPILDSHGQSHGAVAVYQDVTERLQAEKALRVALEKYRVLIESFPLGITVSDESGQILETNKEGERLLGIAQAEQTRRGISSREWQLIRPDGSPMPAEEYASVRALREKRLIDNVEMGIVKEGGAVTWLNVTAAPIPLEGYGVAVAYGDITARKRAESQRETALAALHDSEQRFGSLVTSMTEGVALHSLVYDAQGQAADYVILDVNPAFEAITGLSRDQAVGRKASEVYGTGQPPYLETYARVAASGEPASFETYFPPMDKHFSVSVFSPGPGQFATVFADITERAQVAAERERLLAQARQDRESIAALAQALEKEWHTLQAIMESTHAQLAYLDPDFNFVRVNSAYAQGSGHSREELIGHNHFDLFPNAENQAIFEQVRASGQPAGFRAKPFEFADQPGRGVTYWDWTLVPVKEGEGQARGLVLSLLDVTDQVLSRRAVEELAARDEAILNSLGEGVVTLSPAGDILTINPAAMRILGFEGIEQARQRFEETPNSFEARALNGAVVPVEALPQARLLRGETFSGYEMQVRDLVTGLTWIGSFSGTPVRNAAGDLAMGVLAVHDITVEKQAQAQRDATLEELKAALAEKEVLMREIYHRVKNNVQALIYLMDMQADYIADDDTRQMLRELQERARAMALVHEKLYQSQNLARIDFGEYLYDLVDNLSHAFGAGRPIVWRIDVEDVSLGVDTAIPCGLIVSELLTNALKYAFPGGRPITTRGETDCTVSVVSRVEEDRITLVVADNGVGLPDGIDWATTKTLGLQLINVLACHQLGGQVEVDRRAGASFKITFAERTRK